jgi:hypothetical protein
LRSIKEKILRYTCIAWAPYKEATLMIVMRSPGVLMLMLMLMLSCLRAEVLQTQSIGEMR